jgi:hypothetical protein
VPLVPDMVPFEPFWHSIPDFFRQLVRVGGPDGNLGVHMRMDGSSRNA